MEISSDDDSSFSPTVADEAIMDVSFEEEDDPQKKSFIEVSPINISDWTSTNTGY